MADKTSIEIKIETAAAANSVKDLRTSLKSLKDELNNVAAGSQEFKKISNAINETEGRLGDLNDSFSTFTGSGVERTTKSFNLLKEGFATFDFGKIKSALGGLTAAFRAVPIFLLVEGITYLISNFKELSEGTGILAKVLKPIGVLIGWIKDSLYELTDAIGLTNSALDEMGEIAVKNAESTQAALANQLTEYDRQIKVAKAAGKNTIDLEIAKQQAIIDTNVAIAKQIEAFVRAGGVLDDEKKKLLTASLNAIKDAKVEERVIEENHQNELEAKAKVASDNKKKLLEEETQKRLEELEKQRKYEEDMHKQSEDLYKERTSNILAYQTDYLAQQRQLEDEAYFNSLAKEEELARTKEENARKEKEHRKEVAQNTVSLAAQSVAATQNLTDMYFAQQLKAAKGNADKERELKKKQFNLNKAFNITTAIINGVQAVQGALATQPAYVGIALAVLNGITAAANVAKIASAKFDDSGASAGGGGGDMGGSIGSSASGAPPPIANPSNTVDTTKFGEGGKNLEMTPPKAQVVETEITSKQKIVTKMEGQAVF